MSQVAVTRLGEIDQSIVRRLLADFGLALHLVGDGEQRAADVLGIPFDEYAQGGLFPIAYTKGTDFKLAKRLPAEQLTHWDTW